MNEEINAAPDQAAQNQTGMVKLRAADPEDLAVIAAFLQDSATMLKEMVFRPEERQFAGVFNRFRRERQPDWESCDGLTICASVLLIDDIADVKYRGFDPDDLEQDMSLLTIATEPGKEHLIHIDLVFEGGAEIQLRSDKIMARLQDIGEPHAAETTPCDHFKAMMDGASAQS